VGLVMLARGEKRGWPRCLNVVLIISVDVACGCFVTDFKL
jgi:hypothetical protein